MRRVLAVLALVGVMVIPAAAVAQSPSPEVATTRYCVDVIAADPDLDVGSFLAGVLAGSVTIVTVAPCEPANEGPSVAGDSFGDGIYLVPDDVRPGTYRGTVSGEPYCTWQRLGGVTGDTDDIITFDIATTAGAPVVVTIKKSDAAFKSSGCGPWERVQP